MLNYPMSSPQMIKIFGFCVAMSLASLIFGNWYQVLKEEHSSGRCYALYSSLPTIKSYRYSSGRKHNTDWTLRVKTLETDKRRQQLLSPKYNYDFYQFLCLALTSKLEDI
jgi:hypothetical protein